METIVIGLIAPLREKISSASPEAELMETFISSWEETNDSNSSASPEAELMETLVGFQKLNH